jgi:hypothetical protein
MPLKQFPVGGDAGTHANPLHAGESFIFVNNGAADCDVYRYSAPLEQPAYVVPKHGSVRVDIKENATGADYEYMCYPVLAGIHIVANPKIIIQ